MRITISIKLFIGFIAVIFLNVFYVVVVSKFSDQNMIVNSLKNINEVKNSLLRVENLHRDQTLYFDIYDKLRRKESVEIFQSNATEVSALIDSIVSHMDEVRSLDTLISRSETQYRETMTQLGRINEAIYSLKNQTSSYAETFTSFIKTPNHTDATGHLSAENVLRPTINLLADSASGILTSVKKMLDDQSSTRIKEISLRIENAKTLTMIILLSISTFALLFAYVFSRAMTNSLRKLKESASTLAQGSFDFNPKGYPSDEIGELAMAFFDMSQGLKAAQDQLVKSKRMAAIGEVVASVNHEINNPLMIISGNAQFLEMCLEDASDDIKERLRAIIEETDRISKVTKKLREIRNPVVEDYTTRGEQMINLDKSSS